MSVTDQAFQALDNLLASHQHGHHIEINHRGPAITALVIIDDQYDEVAVYDGDDLDTIPEAVGVARLIVAIREESTDDDRYVINYP